MVEDCGFLTFWHSQFSDSTARLTHEEPGLTQEASSQPNPWAIRYPSCPFEHKLNCHPPTSPTSSLEQMRHLLLSSQGTALTALPLLSLHPHQRYSEV